MRWIGEDDVLDRLFEARRVGHDLAQRDGLAVVLRNLEIEIRVDVPIQVQLALLDQLHRCRPRDQLADRAGPEERAVGIDGRALFDIGVSEAPRGEDLPILHDSHDGARDVSGAQCVGQEAVEPDVNVGFRERYRACSLALRVGRRSAG